MGADGVIRAGSIHVHWIDLCLIVTYLVAMILFGFFYSRRVKDSADYFLAGRRLPWWIIGMSIIGSNIGSNDYVGAAGGAYSIGIAQANFEWIGAIPAMVLASFLFIPFYWKAGVFSIPEYLGLRYSQTVRVISAVVLSLFSVFIVGVFLYATATMLATYIGIGLVTGILITAIVVGLYTITGGLAAVAMSDSVQLVIMFAGAAALAILGVEKAGGPAMFLERLATEHPDHLRPFLPADHAQFPWPGVILGLAFVLSPAYWCTNQVILQRTLAARTRWDGQASMIFAAFAKTMVPFLIILPGFVALVLYPGVLERPDAALPWVIREVLPPGLSGLLFVAFIAALQSSVDSTLNSTAVMITRDMVGVLSSSERSERGELLLGQFVTFLVLAVGVFFAIYIVLELEQNEFEGIYSFVQRGLSYFQGPMFALLSFGILTRRTTASAGLWALVLGVLLAVLLANVSWPGIGELNMLYVAFYSCVFSVALLFGISRFTKPASRERLQNLTIHTTDD
ncbi:MAG: sodium/solute symporter [Spirochaetales bacterium]|nr:sodium/solute symporter [Leptospiraceae bacterium]MCP5483013.1 sodium/solute symporter [Spirochaetales bacterium]MCP5486181.1 sodium/solute symporter [Spirochaetales bacterium]